MLLLMVWTLASRVACSRKIRFWLANWGWKRDETENMNSGDKTEAKHFDPFAIALPHLEPLLFAAVAHGLEAFNAAVERCKLRTEMLDCRRRLVDHVYELRHVAQLVCQRVNSGVRKRGGGQRLSSVVAVLFLPTFSIHASPARRLGQARMAGGNMLPRGSDVIGRGCSALAQAPPLGLKPPHNGHARRGVAIHRMLLYAGDSDGSGGGQGCLATCGGSLARGRDCSSAGLLQTSLAEVAGRRE
jgi:hypothetical protein